MSHRPPAAGELGRSATKELAVEWCEAANVCFERTIPQEGRLSSLPAEWQRELVALIMILPNLTLAVGEKITKVIFVGVHGTSKRTRRKHSLNTVVEGNC